MQHEIKSGIKIAESEDKATYKKNGHSVKEGSRLGIQKTYKLYVDGKFPRSESGRYYKLTDKEGKIIANICRSSRKDFRDAVVVARKAQEGWAKRTAYNKGQILYRIAEMLEARSAQFVENMKLQGYTDQNAKKEITASVDCLVYYAGWSDKYQQIFSSVNPVESSHFNFSFPEPTGVVSQFAAEENALIGLVSIIAPAIVGGNTTITLASINYPITACEFGEVLNSSDVPGGAVNILTGNRKELATHFSSHMDVNAMVYSGNDAEQIKTIQTNAALNVKRIHIYKTGDEKLSPYKIMDLQEIKTTWHPVGS